MLLGFNTNGLVHHRLDEALRLLHDEGFEAVAISPDVGHLDPYRTSPAEVAAIAALCDRLSLRVVVETGARFLLDPRRKHRPNLLESDPAERARRVDFVERCLALAAELGAELVSLWSGARPEGVAPEDAQLRLYDGLATLLDSSEKRGVGLALEPEPGHLVETCAQGLAALGPFTGRPVGLTVDLCHLFVTGEGAEVLAGLGTSVVSVQAADARRGVHAHLPPGEGDVDFGACFGGLDAIGFTGPVCFELSRSSAEAPIMLARARNTFADARKPPLA